VLNVVNPPHNPMVSPAHQRAAQVGGQRGHRQPVGTRQPETNGVPKDGAGDAAGGNSQVDHDVRRPVKARPRAGAPCDTLPSLSPFRVLRRPGIVLRMRLPSQRALFDIPDEVCYLNCAYMAPLMRSVVTAGQEGLARKAQPWEITAPDFFASTGAGRRTFASLLGPPASEADVAIVPAASYGMAVAALNLPVGAGQRVIVLEGEFPSTILTWRERARVAGAELVRLQRPEDDDWTRVVLDAIDDRTAVAALPALHWLDGAILDLDRIRRRLTDVGATLALDLTQSLGAEPIDLAAVDPDFLVAAAYKWLLGPYSIGFLYVAPRWHDGRPLEHNWYAREGSENFGGLIDYPERFRPGARRYDVGEPSNFALLPPAVAAMQQILDWGVANVADTAAALTDAVVARGADLGLTAVAADRRARHYVGLRAVRPLPDRLPERLASHRIYVSVRGGQTLRITPHVYNTMEDIERLFTALGKETSRTRRGSG
jgi:selenocysteine lyase/cysteine desulfurase